MDARELYLDLVVKSVSNLIYGPPPRDPWNDGLFRRNAIPGRDHKSSAHTMVGILRLENLRALAQRTLDLEVPGDFIETGVWRGGCCILLRAVLAANLVTDRKVFVADSFAGLPPPNIEQYPLDAGLTLHRDGRLAISVGDVRANFERYGLLDEQVVFVEGFFSETLTKLDAGPFALIRLDGDMYESTYVALEALYPKLSPGGFVIVDDYGAFSQCRQAVSDYRDRFAITAALHQVDWTAVYWQKTID